MPMEFGQVLRRRRMIRSYDETRAVPPQAIDAVLTAALRAPSAASRRESRCLC
jgi:nitroreductase